MIFFGSRVKHRRRPRKTVSLQRKTHFPLEGRFALPNQIWEFGLKQTDFVILTYLYYRQHHAQEGSAPPTQEDIARCVNLEVRTVKKHLAELVKRGLVMSEAELVPFIPADRNGYFFSLPDEVFTRLDLPHSALMVYALLLCYENRRTHKCHPSYRTIAAATGLAVNTVCAHIGILADKGLIKMEGSSYYDEQGMKWTGNNQYTIHSMRVVPDDRKRQWLRDMELEDERRRAKLHRQRYAKEMICAAEGDAAVHGALPF